MGIRTIQLLCFLSFVGTLGACSPRKFTPVDPVYLQDVQEPIGSEPTADYKVPAAEGSDGSWQLCDSISDETNLNKKTSDTRSSNGIVSYFLQLDTSSMEPVLIHSIEIEGPIAEKYYLRFCYRKNCWGEADFRILCDNELCELEVADHDRPGKFLQARPASANIFVSANSSTRTFIEFRDPFFYEATSDFFYQIWTSEKPNDPKTLRILSQIGW